MSFGQVPVVTPAGSIPTIVTDNINGMFIRVKNAEDIVDAIKLLTTNRELYTKLSSSARETIIAKFDDKKYICTLNSLYKD